MRYCSPLSRNHGRDRRRDRPGHRSDGRHFRSLLDVRGSLLRLPGRLDPVRDAGLDHLEHELPPKVPDGRAASSLVPALTGRRTMIRRTLPGSFMQSPSLTWRRASAVRAQAPEKFAHPAILFDELQPCNMDRWHCAFNPRPDAACSEIPWASGNGQSSSDVPLWPSRGIRETPRVVTVVPLSTTAPNRVDRRHSRLWQRSPPRAPYGEI